MRLKQSHQILPLPSICPAPSTVRLLTLWNDIRLMYSSVQNHSGATMCPSICRRDRRITALKSRRNKPAIEQVIYPHSDARFAVSLEDQLFYQECRSGRDEQSWIFPVRADIVPSSQERLQNFRNNIHINIFLFQIIKTDRVSGADSGIISSAICLCLVA